jgi:HK97 family phage prohead protease
MTTTLASAAQARADHAHYTGRAARPSQRRATDDLSVRSGAVRVELGPIEVREIEHNGLTVVRVGGYASVTETPYQMHDAFGPYDEVVSRGAFGKTLAGSPLVEFTLNHGAGGSMPMAHTRNGTLVLAEDGTGLAYDAYVDPRRGDVADMLRAMERGDLAEASFKFRIESGEWAPDWSSYRINEANLSRGDVSAVNFGANPSASSELRTAPVVDLAGIERRRVGARLALALAE